ncbi:hypothetical protein SARC_06972 [Sphaeroforma arctica JP610]|uniref:Uncharacterized protein n=1 Tax=Sphaeroforma arctica JP610 TaxID=667725 RepID=A0A0L0FXI7_9EUKA|nr:hypothetical protein SARC_06972 [Sphaeroforma arctica JP610]KNC80658.1 hypothetical protein SARC_06972 [Sphaeroforma arctica JP610]|eukprot:XP_014154560.1 hypothetical protein SARC_06972 [Sphaeroforma arctica JP610]
MTNNDATRPDESSSCSSDDDITVDTDTSCDSDYSGDDDDDDNSTSDDCYSGTSVMFAKLEKAIDKVAPGTSVIVRLFFMNGPSENRTPSWATTKGEKGTNDWSNASELFRKLTVHLRNEN